jgi:deoxyribodipyrimidine photolyase-related protein
VKARESENACPFNALYWDFLLRNRDRLAGNPRMAQMYRTWERMAEDRQRATRARAADLLDRLVAGERV